jgi:integrase
VSDHDLAVSAVSVNHFLREIWLPAARGTIRPTTYCSYEMHVRCYLAPAFGHLALEQVTAPAINAFYGQLLRGWNGRAVLSDSTVRRIHATWHRALRDAVRWELLARNPAAAADPPRARRPEMTVWSTDQWRVFLGDAAGDRLYTLWLFYILTGVRRGEALALRWSDVDLVAGTAAIRRSLVPVDHRLVFGEPKTARGRRLIGLDPQLVDALARHRTHHADDQRHRGRGPRRRGPGLRPSRRGAAPSRTGVAAVLLAAGVPPRVLADRLGHSSTAVTTDTYQHVLPQLDHDAARRVADLVFAPLEAPGPVQSSER